jgi:hypothetical protein
MKMFLTLSRFALKNDGPHQEGLSENRRYPVTKPEAAGLKM